MLTIFNILYPPRCPICDGVRLFHEPVCCKSCEETVSYVTGPYCLCCGRPLVSDDREFCFDCSKKKRHYQNGITVGSYEGSLRDSILRFKFHGRCEYASWYAEQLVSRYEDRIRQLKADVLIPIPMHERKARKRGYNQAVCFADEISLRTGTPVRKDILLRTRYTEPQKELNDVARLQNLLSAFSIDTERLAAYKKNHPFERVILVDDIYTTGSTMEACARLLQEVGVKMIAPVTIAAAHGHEV